MRLTLVAAVSLLLVAGCGGEPEPTLQEKKTQAYLNSMREMYPGFNDYPDDKLIAAGEDVCSWLNKGRDFESLVVTAREQEGVPPELMGSIIGAGVPAFCPQHLNAAYKWASGN